MAIKNKKRLHVEVPVLLCLDIDLYANELNGDGGLRTAKSFLWEQIGAPGTNGAYDLELNHARLSNGRIYRSDLPGFSSDAHFSVVMSTTPTGYEPETPEDAIGVLESFTECPTTDEHQEAALKAVELLKKLLADLGDQRGRALTTPK